MGKIVYRMCLAAALAAVIAVGVYYYMSIYKADEEPERGTFVENIMETAEEGLV